MKTVRKGLVALALLVFAWSRSGGVAAQERPLSLPKTEWLAMVRAYIDHVNGPMRTGLSTRHFSVGDSARVVRLADEYVIGVAVDPEYLAAYRSRQPFAEDPNPPEALTQPRDQSPLTYATEKRYNGWVIFRFEPAEITAYHEAVHAVHLQLGPSVGDVDADRYGTSETIANNFAGVVGTLRRLDPTLERMLERMSRGDESLYEEVRSRLDDLKKMTREYHPKFSACLANVGGKMDWEGYEQALGDAVVDARRRARENSEGRTLWEWLAGTWNESNGGVLILHGDGTYENRLPGVPTPLRGRFRCVRLEGQLVVQMWDGTSWSPKTGYALSADGRSFAGKNAFGIPYRATRVGP